MSKKTAPEQKTRPYTLTLTRWHHVAERISIAASRRRDAALALLEGTVLQHAPTQEQIKGLRARGATALDDLQFAREACVVVGRIRRDLANANAKAGVSSLLAHVETLRQELRLAKAVVRIDLLTRVPLDKVAKAMESSHPAQAEAFMPRAAHGIPTCVVALDALSAWADVPASLETAIAVLQDKINDLNKATLEIELPAQFAAVAGL